MQEKKTMYGTYILGTVSVGSICYFKIVTICDLDQFLFSRRCLSTILIKALTYFDGKTR